ncbi:MAG: hypothetical protein QGG73_09395 [Candidatus Hydrogenedentes bacterium]|nr:hypothetical protein [Candidatus Hydrogenedentota bacterium]
MKVTELKTMVVEAEKPYIGGKYFLFLELMTDEGITGIGERIAGSSYSNHLNPDFPFGRVIFRSAGIV